jgi:hypothetical protein
MNACFQPISVLYNVGHDGWRRDGQRADHTIALTDADFHPIDAVVI